MARKNLSSDAMIELSASWLDPNRDRPILERDELLRGPLAIIETATLALMKLRKQRGLVDREIEQLTTTLTALDTRHDRKARAVHLALESGENMADDPAEVERYQTTLLTMFPGGLSITRRSYREQSGAARRLDEQLDARTRAWLDGITFHGHSLLTATEDWIASALELGELYAKREVLRGEDNPEAVTAAQIHAERNRWIRGVNAMSAMLEETDIDTDLRRRLMVNLHHAERQADLAQKASKQPDDGSQPDNVDFKDVQNNTSEPA